MKKIMNNKHAFTMMELVFVIVVVGILSALIAPNFQRNTTREAADQIISHIRYTQHLAMMDDKYDPTNHNWYKNRWSIDLNSTAYSISCERFKNDNTNSGTLYAKNPLNQDQNLSSSGTKELDVNKEYGITIVNNCSSNKRIFFDNMGRPYDANTTATAPQQNLIQGICTIVLSNGNVGEDITIQLHPETGYVNIKQ
jgi:prepilin-type N-terminal cleavage/methylation domain-containing protein